MSMVVFAGTPNWYTSMDSSGTWAMGVTSMNTADSCYASVTGFHAYGSITDYSYGITATSVTVHTSGTTRFSRAQTAHVIQEGNATYRNTTYAAR